MSIVIANAISLVILIAFIVKRWSITHSAIEPGIVFAVSLVLLYPVRGLALIFFGQAAFPQYPGILDESNLRLASWLSVLGSFGYAVGYQFVMRRSRLSIIKPAPVRFGVNEILVCTVLFVGASVGTAYKIATDDYISYLIGQDRNAGLAQIATLLQGLQWPAFLGVWILFFQKHRTPPFLILFCLVNVVVIPYQFIQGSKTFLSLLMVSVIFAYYWTRGKLPKLTVLFAIAIIVVVVFPFVENFRDNINYEFGRIPTIMSLNSEVLFDPSLQATDQNRTLGRKLAHVSSRFGGTDELYGIIDLIPRRLDYRYGLEYSAFFVNLIPRMIWPSKPTFSRGAAFGSALDTITSVTPFPYGEAYWDLGTTGVLVMMIVWGALLAVLTRIYERFYRNPKFRFLVAVYFISQIYWIAGGEASMPATLSGIPQQLVVLVAVYMGFRATRRVSVSIGAIRRVQTTQEYF